MLHACDRILEYKQNAFCFKQIGPCVQELECTKHCTLTALSAKTEETSEYEGLDSQCKWFPLTRATNGDKEEY